MTRSYRSLVLTIVGLAAVFLAGVVVPVAAKTAYDGNWSVLIVTESGTCDRGYRYPIMISNGRVEMQTDQAPGIDLSGRVAGGGQVTVNVGSGDQRATATGRLASSTGGGTWKGRASSSECAGRWEAERR
jgi:hypothetical protein